MIKRVVILSVLLLSQIVGQTPIGVGLYEQTLFEYVVDNYKTTTTLGYNLARDILYGTIDLKEGNQLSCVYSGYTITLDTTQDPSTNAYQQGINCEHSWPQSMGAGSEPQKSDMHHLFPCKSNVNSSRGNDPFADIPDSNTEKWYRNDTILYTIPTEYIEEYAEKYNPPNADDETFEPREDHKGDAARAMFYFYAMYHDAADTNFWNVQKNVLLDWHYNDPVDQWEENRTWAIAGYQENMPNPFVLDSTLARRIWFYSPIISSPFRVIITEIMANPSAVSDPNGEWFEIYNNDTMSINLSDWQIADRDNDLHTIFPPQDQFFISPGEYMVFSRNADSTINGGYSADYEYSSFQLANSDDEIKIIDGDGLIVDEVEYNSSFPFSSGASMYLRNIDFDNNVDTSWAMSEMEYGLGDLGTPGRAWDDSLSTSNDIDFGLPQTIVLNPAYPNPFNPKTTIRFTLGARHTSQLRIFDISGGLVDNLINDELNPGTHEFVWNAKDQPSGVYFVQLSIGESVQTQKVILLK